MDAIDIHPVKRPFYSTVHIPGSKSITNRALPLAALSTGDSELTGVLFADDTWQMINALQSLGYSLSMDQNARTVRITGRGADIPKGTGQRLSCGNSGTTIRFLTALLTLGSGTYILDGVPRMRQRPIDQLVDQLKILGADITYELSPGFPPLHIHAKGLAGGGCQFSDAKSSQYISAILMAAPYAQNAVTVSLLGPVTSEPYVVMTLRMMEQFAVHAHVHDQCGQTPSRGEILETFEFPRQESEPFLCLADYLKSVESGEMDYVAFFSVTAGKGIRAIAEKLKEEGRFLENHALQALALETAEGLAEFIHRQIRDRWGFPDPINFTMRDRFAAKYQGQRYSFGYPACPNLEDQEKLFKLISPEDIGIELTEGFMMEPEASVTALVFAHPDARYFNVLR